MLPTSNHPRDRRCAWISFAILMAMWVAACVVYTWWTAEKKELSIKIKPLDHDITDIDSGAAM